MGRFTDNWIEYWNQDQFWSRNILWKINSELLLHRASQFLTFKKDDSILDIGCGSGHIGELLAPMVESILAVDVAEQFVKLCKQRCMNYSNVSTQLLNDDYTKLHFLKKQFSLILCVSVVQYYNNIKEIETLIRSIQKIALPGAKMLIADLPLKRGVFGFAWDSLCSFLLSIKEGYTFHLLSTAFSRWCWKSVYKSFCKNNKTLEFSIQDIEELIKRMDLKAKIITKSFSIYANRPSILIQL
ncbi:MAG TPA: class I SAM-dependent methyltransferase [Nitrospinota bacterium]|nr:class I SAM-dependent methyltransferase [Nitrospinota bacterium]